jgi:selenide,water dikinase
VGNETLDDAACFIVSSDGSAIVQTVDFFTPIVDDPVTFGRIAATNAISDIYAMGGTPLFALALGGFPAEMDRGTAAAILRGGEEAAARAEISILGGHTIVAAEPIYGLTVTGTVKLDAIWRNAGAQPGDVLVLTKALGTGVISNALQQEKAPDEAIDAAIASMTTLNRSAATALRERAPHAVTDVTGFGLLGHAHEMALASGVEFLLNAAALPLLPHALELARLGLVPGGSRKNRHTATHFASFASSVEPAVALLACDAQTSGGLLAALPETCASGIGTVVGRVASGVAGRVTIS